MSPLRPSSAHRLLRLVALGLLLLGIAMTPVFAAACDVNDALWAAGGEQLVSPDEDGGENPCCPGQACGQCCTVGASLPAATTAVPQAVADTARFNPDLLRFEPPPRAEAIRPPIAS